VGKFTQCMPACHIHREQSGYNCSPSVQISQIGLANCCAGKKFRSTVDLGSFPFRYKRAGVERRGKNSEASDVPLRSRVRSPSSPLDGTFAGTVPGEAEVGETIGSLSRQEGVPGDEALTAVWSAAPRERRDMTARTQ